MIQIVTAAYNLDMYSRNVSSNPFMNVHSLHLYDNTQENIGIAKRYNEFITTNMVSDSWIVFCHQDFAFRENIAEKLANLDKGFLYGPTGTGPAKQLIFIAAFSRYGIERFRLGFYDRTKKFGQIIQSTDRKTQKMGTYLRKPAIVDTVDCCCLIIHAELIQRFGLVFDERLDWHMYVEDLCLNARYRHQILTKAVQFDCTHYSGGTTNADFDEAVLYVKNKYGTGSFATTCYDGYWRF